MLSFCPNIYTVSLKYNCQSINLRLDYFKIHSALTALLASVSQLANIVVAERYYRMRTFEIKFCFLSKYYLLSEFFLKNSCITTISHATYTASARLSDMGPSINKAK